MSSISHYCESTEPAAPSRENAARRAQGPLGTRAYNFQVLAFANQEPVMRYPQARPLHRLGAPVLLPAKATAIETLCFDACQPKLAGIKAGPCC